MIIKHNKNSIRNNPVAVSDQTHFPKFLHPCTKNIFFEFMVKQSYETITPKFVFVYLFCRSKRKIK
jgi:hypothetical protein